jgi:hypothetical protein
MFFLKKYKDRVPSNQTKTKNKSIQEFTVNVTFTNGNSNLDVMLRKE